MKVYRLYSKQGMKCSKEEAWEFLSDPRNLRKITPKDLDFQITNDPSERMYPGMIITYNLKPLLGITQTWVTEITQVNHPDFFIDEQRFGPYNMWHHEHRISEGDGEVVMEDEIHYVIPFGYLGRIANSLIVKNELKKIFKFRQNVITEMFGESKIRSELKII